MQKEQFKIIVIGNTAVGKTSLVQKFTKGIFANDYKNTIGAEYFIKSLKIDDKEIELQIWDTSFENIPSWLEEAKNNIKEETIFVLVGTKSDIERNISFEEGLELMNEFKLDLFLETSSKTGEGVVKMFEDTTKEIINNKCKINKLKQNIEENNKVGLEIIHNQQKTTKKKCC